MDDKKDNEGEQVGEGQDGGQKEEAGEVENQIDSRVNAD